MAPSWVLSCEIVEGSGFRVQRLGFSVERLGG